MATKKKALKKSKLRHAEYYDFQEIQDRLYAESMDGKVFTSLVEIITLPENIKLAYRNIKKNKGSKTAGTDGKTIQHLEKLSEEKLIALVQRKCSWYVPQSVRRVEIPKDNGKTRPLGIPTIMDRLVQQCVLQVLEPICEAKFHDHSYGFRPNRSQQHAISQVHKDMQLSHLHYVVDIDIKGFFDMTSKSPVRSCDDVDEQALSYAEVKALCAGNPLIKEKMDLDVQVAKLKVLKADHQSQKYRLEDKLLTQFPADIQQQRAHISALKTDAETAAAHPQDKENFCGMTIKGMMFDDKKTAGERLVLAAKELPDTEPVVLGEYRGFELSVRYEPVRNEQQAVLKGKAIYPVALGADPHGNITRLDNLLAGFDERIANAENRLENLLQQQTAAQAEVEKPFPQEEELAQKSARLAELNAQLDVDEKHHEPEMEETPDEESARPSVLAALNEKSDKEEPVKPFRSYSDRDGDAR